MYSLQTSHIVSLDDLIFQVKSLVALLPFGGKQRTLLIFQTEVMATEPTIESNSLYISLMCLIINTTYS